ncbi:hypothetical protein LTR84_005239 [Exophiala bonariae]|uniref:EKC/KEOPS complex subunit GON7 n=1 Tax=Exophiala bonariae TaxID=1690606 RepID=A0AAV9NQ51_9EURO|nr:hypothetical protein LTR84_005239 [Exophiala bonariae]
MPAPSDTQQAGLSASYKSPTDTKQFHYAIDTSGIATSETNNQLDKKSQTAYFGLLRASTKNLQDDINDFLTRKMDEDKKYTLDSSATKSKTKEELEEENYGEEVVDDDDTG